MRGRLIGVLVALLMAGCAAPGARIDPAAVDGVLDGITLEGATAERLPDGDLRLTLAGETARRETRTFTVPEGVTFVEAVITTAPGARFQTGLFEKATGLPMCWPQRHQAWYLPVDEELRCTALGLVSPGEWEVVVAPQNGNLVKPFTLTLTLSTQPLDGSAARLKLDQLSKPVFDARPTESFKVPASTDGAKLHVEVTRPATDEPVPVILVASPYNTADRAADGIANENLALFGAARGYAVATMDLRGTGISGGCFSMRGAVDQRDVADVVDWLGAQEWSNGKVGMYGISYEGFTPVAAAVQQPKHLAAIFIGAPAIDMYANYRPGGVETGRTLGTGVVGYVVGNAAQTTSDPENPLGPVQYRADAVCDPAAFTLGNDPRMTYDAWWKERNLSEMADRIAVPVHVEQGFWDNPVKANAVADWFNLLTVEKRAILGSWEHIWALRADEQLRFLAWMDQWLKDRDTGILDTPVVEVLTNTRQHRAADAWPSPDAAPHEVELASGGFSAPAGSLVTKTDAYADGLYVSGVPTVALRVALPAGGNALLHAELFEVHADGERKMVIMGWLNAAHKDGHRAFASFAPGETRDVELRLLPVDHVVQPGSSLELVLRTVRTSDTYGTPEGALLSPPIPVRVDAGTLRLPTLPMDTLAAAPRSAS